MKNKSGYFGTGITSVLMIFVVLCLGVFGVLVFVTARGDYLLTQKNAQTVRQYYAAVSQAENALADLDEYLITFSPKDALEKAGFETENGNARFECKINQNSVYVVLAEYTENDCTVTAQKTESTVQWQEENLDVWDGE